MVMIMVLIYWMLSVLLYVLDRKSLLSGKRESIVYCMIGGCGLILSIAILVRADLPGPTEWITALYKPFSSILDP
ncbi:hypothetical protein [Paenibacillus nasutitermitis]|uniref:Uncharacterized protein n=1 Tax=Paenibacillus nasutitermitis TaxID=1652958 RepID=A0A917E1R6_9BACL|nr:hypothetical protein [Paenibacillus nasutitermitis]GGD93373.1 hypothetical protein GCM10010911_59970 [Paenibacillus nasutitermitis]